MTKEELETGKRYWFVSFKKDKLVELTFMNKVHHRSAFRFSEEGKNKLFIVHASRLNRYTFTNHKEAQKEYALHMNRRRIQQEREEGYYGREVLNAPVLLRWDVVRGFARRVRFGRW